MENNYDSNNNNSNYNFMLYVAGAALMSFMTLIHIKPLRKFYNNNIKKYFANSSDFMANHSYEIFDTYETKVSDSSDSVGASSGSRDSSDLRDSYGSIAPKLSDAMAEIVETAHVTSTTEDLTRDDVLERVTVSELGAFDNSLLDHS